MNNDVLDQTPPQNIEAEKAVLGAIFLNSDALVEAMEFVEAQDFYRRAHQIIFASMVTLNDRDEAIDAVTVSDLLTAQNQLDDVGGMSYIAELAGSVPTAANAGYYAKIVAQKATVRRLIKTATEITQKAYTENDDVTTLLDDAERDIMNVSEQRN
ncbi:MAG: replicative DNA helicase, partial [Lacticaseibacillus paracasei]|nr:replicative DNA helicase [Lacticaseibacillus paracasei]